MDEKSKEVGTILIIGIILGISISYGKAPIDYILGILSILVVIVINSIAKYVAAYNYESDITIKPWAIQQYGFERRRHFKKPLPMIWLPLILAMISSGKFWWLAAFQFEAKPRVERMVKRHRGRYKFKEMTEQHIGYIAFFGFILNIAAAAIAMLFGLTFFAKLNVLYALWSLLPISNLDGTKILFANKALWVLSAIIAVVMFVIAYQ